MKILSIDSSSVTASVALIQNGEILSECFINNGLTHSQTLMPMVEETLEKASVKLSEVDLFAVTVGPGSFTGIRIGIAAVKGMADALGKKCVPVSTLEAIAKPLDNTDSVICSVMDARCNQVYTASFKTGERLCGDSAILIDELGEYLKGLDSPIVLIGDGALMCCEKLKERVKDIRAVSDDSRFIHASSIGFIAEQKLKDGEEPIDSEKLVPFYLRLPQAERELNNKKLKKEKEKKL